MCQLVHIQHNNKHTGVYSRKHIYLMERMIEKGGGGGGKPPRVLSDINPKKKKFSY